MPLNKDDVKGGLKKGPRPDTRTYVDTTHGTLKRTTVVLPPEHRALADRAAALHAERRSATSYPASSGAGAIVAATGGTASYDKAPGLRPEDLTALHKAAKHNPGVRMIGEIVSDPSGLINLGRAGIEFAHHPDVLTGGGAGLAAAGLFAPGLRRATKAAKAAEAAQVAGKDLPAGAKELNDVLPEAAKLRAKQERGYSAPRAKKIADYKRIHADALARGLDPEEAHLLAKTELAGELPKLHFTAGQELSRDNLPAMFQHINDHPELQDWEKIRTTDALRGIFAGKVPTKSELKLLSTAFGEHDAHALATSTSLWKHLAANGLDFLNLPRALKSSLDLSAMFRQALVLGARHPRMFASEIKPALKAFRSENAYKDIMNGIASHPDFKAAVEWKVAFTDLGDSIGQREEAFASRLANHIPGVRASSRNYAAFLNKFRMDAFSNYLRLAEEPHWELHFQKGLPVLKKVTRDTNDQRMLKDIASWVNHSTGRGSIQALEGAMVPLQATLFSPRLIASRLQLLNPVYYAKLDPFARTQALRGFGQLLGGLGLTLYMAKLAGAQVGVDPRSANFGKIRIGNTRVDLMGGFQQYIVAAARLYKKEMVSSTTGQVVTLQGGYAKPSRADIGLNFFESKLAPVPRFFDQWAHNENDDLKPFHPVKELPLLFAPLGPQQTYQTYKQNGPAPAAAAAVLGTIGFGVQTYGPKADATYKAQLKLIDQAVKKGQLTEEEAQSVRRDVEEAHRLSTGSKDERRQIYIDQMRQNGSSVAEINEVLKHFHMDPVR